MSGHIFAAADRWRGCDRGPVRRQPDLRGHRRRHRARRAGDGRGVPRSGARCRRGHGEHEEHRAGGAGGRFRLPGPAVQDAGGVRGGRRSCCFCSCPRTTTGLRIGRSVFFLVGAGFSAAIGYLGMSLAVRANVRVAAAARRRGPRPGHEDRVPHRRCRRHGDRRPRPAGRVRRRADLQVRRPDRARGLRLRRRPARDVHAGRRRHLHQGRRRRRRPGRQGREQHPRGRPAQRGDDRRQRGRQRR